MALLGSAPVCSPGGAFLSGSHFWLPNNVDFKNKIVSCFTSKLDLFGNSRRIAIRDKQTMVKYIGNSSKQGRARYFIEKRKEVGSRCFEWKSIGAKRIKDGAAFFIGWACRCVRRILPVGVCNRCLPIGFGKWPGVVVHEDSPLWPPDSILNEVPCILSHTPKLQTWESCFTIISPSATNIRAVIKSWFCLLHISLESALPPQVMI